MAVSTNINLWYFETSTITEANGKTFALNQTLDCSNYSIYRVGHKYCYKIKYKYILKKAFISIFKFANIQDSYQKTISLKLYSKCFPLAFTTAQSLLEKSLIEAHTIFTGIFSHVFINFNFRASILGLDLEQASLSRIDHNE